MNILLLWGESVAKGYAAPIWMTYKQAQELGANVRKGEHGSLVVYANSITKTETNEKGEDTEREIPFMKGYTFQRRAGGRPADALLRATSKPAPTVAAYRNRRLSPATPYHPSSAGSASRNRRATESWG